MSEPERSPALTPEQAARELDTWAKAREAGSVIVMNRARRLQALLPAG